MCAKWFHRWYLDKVLAHSTRLDEDLVQLSMTENQDNSPIKIEVYFFTQIHGQPRVGMPVCDTPHISLFAAFQSRTAIGWSGWPFWHQPPPSAFQPAGRKNGKGKGTHPLQGLSSEAYTTLLLLCHWPELDHMATSSCKDRLGIKPLLWIGMTPTKKGGHSLLQNWANQLEQYWPLGQDKSLLDETFCTFQDTYASRPQTLPKCQ